MTVSRRYLAIALAVLSSASFAQDKKRLTPEEYGTWEALGPVAISNDGKWVLANVTRIEADSSLIVRSSDGPQKWVQDLGTRGTFSEDSNFVVFTVNVPRKEAEELRKQKKRPEGKMGILNLTTGSTALFDSVANWTLVKGTSKLVIQKFAAEGAGKAGGDCEIFDLATGGTTPFGNVKNVAVHRDKGVVALHTVSPTDNEGVIVVNCADMKTTTVAWAKMHFGSFTWAEEADSLAFVSGEEKKDKEGDWATIAVARGFLKGQMEQAVFDPPKMAGFPEEYRVLEAAGIQLRKDGGAVGFGIAPWKDKEKPGEKKEDAPGVEIWNTKDVDVVPLQSKSATRDRNRATRCLWTLEDGAFTQFASPELEGVRLLGDMSRAVALDAKPYESAIKVNGLEYVDVLVIDTKTGEKRNLLTKAISSANGVDAASLSYSPEGGYVMHFDGNDWILHDLKSGTSSNVTKALKADFTDAEDDHTVPKPPSGGRPTWLKDDKAVIVHSDYDAFYVDPATGRATRMTEGESDRVRYRAIDARFHDDGIHVGDPIYIVASDTKTKQMGFMSWTEKLGLQNLFADDARVSWAGKSKNTDRVLFVYQTFEKSPTVYLSNLAFSAAKPVIETNEKQKDYDWGTARLVDFKALGKDLQGVLIYPAGFEPGKKYPMVTTIYERLSDELHAYEYPSNTNPYSEQHFSQAGYFVFKPDLAYKDRQPGTSAVKCIEAALKAAFKAEPAIDATKVGLTGHSWGGYETVFTATQSKMFAAYVAGAPLTELLSMYNSFYWNSGQSNQVIFEVSQGRMGVPWWEDTKSYIENSPLFHAGDITSPMLVEVGTVDGAVDWHQGQYLYNTLRRMGKNMVMLVYANENHGLAVPANQKDYAKRARHFFDVYLKGATPERWVDKGVPFIELGEELKPKSEDKKDPEKKDGV